MSEREPTLRLCPSIRDLAEAEWDALAGVAEAPFLRWAFLDTLERTGCVGGDTGWTPCHLAVERAGKLVLAAPAYVKEHSEGEFVFDWSWASAAQRAGLRYYPKLVVASPFTPATGARALVAQGEDEAAAVALFAQALPRVVSELGLSGAHVLFPTEAQVTLLAAAGLEHRLGVQFQWKNQGYATFDDFLGTLPSKRRTQIRRERKELAKTGLRLETRRGGDATPELVDAMFDFYSSTVAKFRWGRQYLQRAFFEEIVTRLPTETELVIAWDGERPIAGAFNLAGPRALYGRYWGAREERPFLHFNVCFYHSIDDAIARKLERFEPGAGGEHKLARGFDPTLTHSAHYLRHPGLARAVRDFVTREREAVREAVARGHGDG